MAVIAVSTDLSAAYASGVGEVTNADAVTSFAECTGTGGTCPWSTDTDTEADTEGDVESN